MAYAVRTGCGIQGKECGKERAEAPGLSPRPLTSRSQKREEGTSRGVQKEQPAVGEGARRLSEEEGISLPDAADEAGERRPRAAGSSSMELTVTLIPALSSGMRRQEPKRRLCKREQEGSQNKHG